MKAINPELAAASQTPVFPKTLYHLRPNPKATTPNLKSEKRGNTFSKSRDTREDRSTREMKTSHNAQTFSHAQ